MLLIRPTGVKLVGIHADEHHLAGTVADVAFRGRGYEHAIDIPGHCRLTGVFAPVRAERGETVGLRLDAAGCHVFAADQDEPYLQSGHDLAGTDAADDTEGTAQDAFSAFPAPFTHG